VSTTIFTSAPIGYLLGVAVAGLMTLIALVSPRLRGPLGAASFRLGLTVSELPFQFGYLMIAATLFAATQGDLGSYGGLIGVAAATLTLVGLAAVARRGWQARPAVSRALDDGLGAGWQASLDPAAAHRPQRRRPWGRILGWPFPVRPPQVTRVSNRRYGPAGRRNQLDVYHYRSRPAGAPMLVYLHGGGYYSGRKDREALPLLHRLAAQGWVCVSANYRLRPQAGFPDHLVDAKKVIVWARQNAGRYGGDPATLFLAGSSAGGHLTMLAALTPNDPALQPGFPEADTSITGAISLYGYYGCYYGRDAAEGIRSTPFAYPAADAPPIFLAHGDRDSLVPVHTARHLATRLRSLSTNPVVYAELPGGHHAFDLFHSLRFEAVVDGVEAFTSWVRSRRTVSTEATE
jgi:acetyl esterase/lipase